TAFMATTGLWKRHCSIAACRKGQARRGAVGRGRAPPEVDHSFADAAEALPLLAWQPVIRRFRDGHTERWWAAELTLFGYGPDKPVRAVCATTDRSELPALSTWYLTTNLSREQAPLGEIVRLYGLRNWVEQSYKQMKDELGWALLLVRSDRAIRRHWTWVVLRICFLLVARCLSSPRGRLVHATHWYPRSAARGGEKKLAPSRRWRAGRACYARCAPG
ncbi:MAG: transposase, partial [Polaromonas sp.]|nr:transposase [Polaromonas sp.]